jgi:hypothetical protein
LEETRNLRKAVLDSVVTARMDPKYAPIPNGIASSLPTNCLHYFPSSHHVAAHISGRYEFCPTSKAREHKSHLKSVLGSWSFSGRLGETLVVSATARKDRVQEMGNVKVLIV